MEDKYWSGPWSDPGLPTCIAIDLNITSLDQIATSLNGQTESHIDVVGFLVQRQTLKFFPKGIEKFLPNLERINIYKSQMQSIRNLDLKPFTNLTELYLDDNDIEVIPDDLFAYNPELEVISFSNNTRLRAVGKNVIQVGTKMRAVYFRNAGCANVFETWQPMLTYVRTKVENNCSNAEHQSEFT